MIFLAPFAIKPWITANPMGPPPRMSTESPSLKGLMLIACHATAIGSTSAGTTDQPYSGGHWSDLPAISNDTFSGISYTALRGTTQCSESPPPQPTNYRWRLSPMIAVGPTTQTYKPIVVAAIDVACLACPTGSVIYDGLDGDSCSNLDITHALTYLFNGAAELVAQS